MRILVSGATGTVGGELVRQLAADDVAVRAISRKPADAKLGDGVEVVFGDADQPDSITAAARGVDAAFVMAAGQDCGGLRALVDAGVERIAYLSALTVQTRPGFLIGKAHEVAERELRKLLPDAVILRPGQYASNITWWADMVRSGTVYVPFPDVASTAIDPYDVAAVARVALLDESGQHAGASFPLSGPELATPRQRLATLGRVLDRDLRLVEIDRATAKSRMPLPDAYADAALDLTGNPTAEETQVFPTVQELLGRPPHTFADWAERSKTIFE